MDDIKTTKMSSIWKAHQSTETDMTSYHPWISHSSTDWPISEHLNQDFFMTNQDYFKSASEELEDSLKTNSGLLSNTLTLLQNNVKTTSSFLQDHFKTPYLYWTWHCLALTCFSFPGLVLYGISWIKLYIFQLKGTLTLQERGQSIYFWGIKIFFAGICQHLFLI